MTLDTPKKAQNSSMDQERKSFYLFPMGNTPKSKGYRFRWKGGKQSDNENKKGI